MPDDREFQADFETGSERKGGTSTDRRPDAVSLDYLRAFTLGPVALQNPDDGVFDYAWYIRVDNSVGEAYIARENDAGDDWQAESLLFSFDETVAEISECDLAFDQNGNTVFVAERPTGSGGDPELWIRFFDPTLSTQDFSSYGPGRTPRALLDAPRQSQRSDVLVFYFNDTADELEYRVQNETYDTVHGTGLTGVSTLTAEELVKAVDSRLQVIYSDHDAASGTYTLDRLASVLYPILAQIEAYQPTHQVLSVIFEKVVTRLSNQSTEAYQPTHEVLSALLEDVIRILGDQPTEAYQPKHEVLAATLEDVVTVVLSNQPTEAYQPTHEVIAATLEEVIIRLENQPIEAFQPTHEVVVVDLVDTTSMLNNAIAVYDAHDLALSDGDAVSTWPDQNNGHDLSQGTASEQPTYRAAGLNGEPAVDFTAADEHMQTADAALADLLDAGASGTVLVVLEPASTGVFGNFVTGGNDSDSNQLWSLRQTDTDDWQFIKRDGGASSDVGSIAGGLVEALPRVVAFRVDGTNDEITEDDVVAVTGAVNRDTLGCNQFSVGVMDRGPGGLSNGYVGLVGAVAVFDSYLTDANLTQAYRELADRFGLRPAPDQIADLAGWYEADALALADGDAVSTWPDAGPDGNDATQSTASQQPTYKDGVVNGKPVVRFDGDDLLDLSIPLTATQTVLLVCTPDQAGNSVYILSSDGSGGAPAVISGYNADFEWFHESVERQTFADGVTGFHLLGVRRDDANPLVGRFDLREQFNTTADNQASGKNLVRFGRSGGGNPYTGDIAAVVVYDRILTPTEVRNVERYLNDKYRTA